MGSSTHISSNLAGQSQRGSWLRTHMAQLMVITNGVILTITAFFTLGIFVKESLRDEYITHNALLKKEITAIFYDYEKSILDFARTGSHQHIEDFVSVYLADIKVDQLPRVIKGDTRDTINFSAIKSAITDDQPGMLIYADGPMKQTLNEKGASVSMRRFMLINKLENIPGNSTYLISVINPDKFSQRLGLEKNSVLRKVEIDLQAGMTLYVMDNAAIDQIKGVKSSTHDQTIATVISKSDLIIRLTYLKQKHLSLVEVVPWLILCFGLILTVIGWMYVSTNQHKSSLLSQVNRTLEVRNRELGQEVNEREKLNQILRKSERENIAIINAVSDVIFEISLNGDILFLNEAWTRITGFPVEETISQNIFSFVHLHDQDEQRKNVSQLVKGQRQAYRSITRLRNIEGTFRSVEMAISMLRLDESKSLRIVGSFTDIDGRERAEKALVEAERKYRGIWENAAGGIYQITPEGQFLSANPAMATIFGYDMAEHLLRDVRNAHQQLFVQPHERLRVIKALKADDQPVTMENQAYTKDNRKIWVQETMRPVFDENGVLQYFEGSVQEVTGRREAEEKLKDAKLASDVANRAKSEFLANMSHELRTPLNSIIGFSEIIKNEVFGPVEPRPYWEYARDIHDSGKHLLSIINQILDISRIDAGERELKDSVVDIPKVAGICVEIVMPKAKSANLTLLEVGFEKAPKVIGEEIAIKQMLINILSNAVKFTPAGGRITISAEHEEAGPLRLSVTDTGVGLDEDEIERAMSPFGVLDGKMNKSTSGIGLGLSLVQALMKLHGGRLEIFSQKGIGTTVTLVFPAERVQAA